MLERGLYRAGAELEKLQSARRERETLAVKAQNPAFIAQAREEAERRGLI